MQTASLSAAPLLPSPVPLPTQPRPLATGEVTIQIYNEAEQTICSVYISPVTATDWSEDWLDNHTIVLGETYELSVAQGIYDVQMEDCDDNVLLEERRNCGAFATTARIGCQLCKLHLT